MAYEGEIRNDRKWNGKGYDINGNIIYKLINGNGKVKEYYYNDNLEFEGEYLNGKRNGKGKEYAEYGGKCVELEYEGEYLNGEKKGKGKEFDFDSGNLIFEGEYLNGVKNGNGKKYFYCFLEFEGEYLNGKNGTVRVMIPNKLFHMN